MGASITLAGEALIAQKHVNQQALDVVRFIFANVPGLNASDPVDRAAGKPPANQIMYTATIPPVGKGYVNPNQVVYSVQAGSDVGDWDFNWIGLETAEGVLFAVSYVPVQQKRKNIPPLQIGNNLTRNFLVVFDGAQALTGLTIDASTWQHDFTVRLTGIDERQRRSNRDTYGRACFFGSSLQLEKVGSVYQLKTGTAYVEGIRLARSAVLPVVPPALPTTAWLDVALQRELNDVVANWSVVFGANKVDYIDSVGVQHYCVPLADIPSTILITDRRPVEPIATALVEHFAARTGDYAGLRARATTKDDVDLGNLPNAKSDDEASDSSEILATTKAVKSATATIWTAIANIVSGATSVGKAVKLATARTFAISGDVTATAVNFDGSGNVSLVAAIAGLAWSKITGRPTTVAGYGITDAWTLSNAPASLTSSATIWTKRPDDHIQISGNTVINLNSAGTGTKTITLPVTLATVKSARASGVIATLGDGHMGQVTNVSTTFITLGAKGLNSGTIRVDWTVEGTV